MGGATADDGRSEDVPLLVSPCLDAESWNKYLEVCSLYTCLEKGRSTLGTRLKTIFQPAFLSGKHLLATVFP